VPFVQGHLRQEALSFSIASECGHCHRPLHIEIDADLSYHVVEAEAEPVIYTPLIDLHSLEDRSIIDAF
jgi:hypothetical protein